LGRILATSVNAGETLPLCQKVDVTVVGKPKRSSAKNFNKVICLLVDYCNTANFADLAQEPPCDLGRILATSVNAGKTLPLCQKVDVTVVGKLKLNSANKCGGQVDLAHPQEPPCDLGRILATSVNAGKTLPLCQKVDVTVVGKLTLKTANDFKE
jgi:hypothetical protein